MKAESGRKVSKKVKRKIKPLDQGLRENIIRKNKQDNHTNK